jgi:hypothetical protein
VLKRTPLRRHTALARSPFPSRTALRPVSAKRRRQAPARRRCCEQVRARKYCEALLENCTFLGQHVHEVVSRARGGSITDASNCLYVCASCHRAIHDNPAEATRLGLLKSREV